MSSFNIKIEILWLPNIQEIKEQDRQIIIPNHTDVAVFWVQDVLDNLHFPSLIFIICTITRKFKDSLLSKHFTIQIEDQISYRYVDVLREKQIVSQASFWESCEKLREKNEEQFLS